MVDKPSGTVTFLFTDIEGSTRLWEHHPEAMATALARHDAILRAAIDAHGGAVFATGGDGIAAAFGRSADGVAAAIAAQRALQAEQWPAAASLQVRMGLHTGEAEERDGDFFGPPVNRAARVMSAAHGRQIVLSDVTAQLLGHADGMRLVDLGSHRLKGLTDEMHVFGVHADGLEWLDRPLSTEQEVPGNLPRPSTEFVGRLDVLQRRAAELAERRLVTLTGPGGVGKTRTAIEAGWLTLDVFPGGAWLVELAAILEPEGVVPAVAAALSVSQLPGSTMAASIVAWMRGRRMLLILDNCEHVVKATAELCAAIIAGCETVTIVATSREPLGMAGERVVSVRSLDSDDAVELFRERAAAADDRTRYSDDDLALIAQICERLDGIPLAIELAAARARMLSPAELLARLHDRFRLLRAGGRGAIDRHHTLRATVSWSYQLLTDDERLLFDRLSVFAGTFDLGAVEAVCATSPLDEADLFDLLGSLVDKSMVVAEHTELGTRFRMLETLRQFGEEQLGLRGESAMLRQLHMVFYAERARELGRQLAGAGQVAAGAALSEAWDNLRAAHQWAVSCGELEPAEALIVGTKGHAEHEMRHEHAEWVQRTITLGESMGRPSTTVYSMHCDWLNSHGREAEAMAAARRGIEVAPSLEDPSTVTCWSMLSGASPLLSADSPAAHDALAHMEAAVANIADIDAAWWDLLLLVDAAFNVDAAKFATHRERMHEVAARVQAPALSMYVHQSDAFMLLLQPEPDCSAAFDHLQRAIALARTGNDVRSEAAMLRGLAMVAVVRGDPDTLGRCHVALEALYSLRYWQKIWQALDSTALALARSGDSEGAALLLGHLQAHVPAYGMEKGLGCRVAAAELVAAAGDFAADFARGQRMTPDELVAEALRRSAADDD